MKTKKTAPKAKPKKKNQVWTENEFYKPMLEAVKKNAPELYEEVAGCDENAVSNAMALAEEIDYHEFQHDRKMMKKIWNNHKGLTESFTSLLLDE